MFPEVNENHMQTDMDTIDKVPVILKEESCWVLTGDLVGY